MKCDICGDRAIAYVKHLGAYLCKGHFVDYFEARVKRTLLRFKLVAPGDRVAVAVSGGKDSIATLYLLKMFSRELGYEVFGLAVDEGIQGYREYKLDALKKIASSVGVRLLVASFREYLGCSLDEAAKILLERGLEIKPCTVCGVFRRYVINKVAREMGATKLAMGHNLDDEIQVYLMNLLKGNIANLSREGIMTGTVQHHKFVRRIKPLYFILEKETLIYTRIRGLYTPFVECPYVVYSMRHNIRRWINRLEFEEPGSKLKFMASKELLVALLEGRGTEMGLNTCRVCGEPSSGYTCRACQLRSYLGVLTHKK